MADMDIEMDLDIGFTEEDLVIPEVVPVADTQLVSLREMFNFEVDMLIL